MSEIGSVIVANPSLGPRDADPSDLPRALRHSSNVALEGALPEAESAHRELPHVGTRASTEVAPVAEPNLVLGRLALFRLLRGGCHYWSS